MTTPSTPDASVVPPERFRDGKWVERVEIARDARDAAKQLRMGKPIVLPEKRFLADAER